MEQMRALDTDAIAIKLRILASLVFGLLGCLAVWSALMHVLDNIGRKDMLLQLMKGTGAQSTGFKCVRFFALILAAPGPSYQYCNCCVFAMCR